MVTDSGNEQVSAARQKDRQKSKNKRQKLKGRFEELHKLLFFPCEKPSKIEILDNAIMQIKKLQKAEASCPICDTAIAGPGPLSSVGPSTRNVVSTIQPNYVIWSAGSRVARRWAHERKARGSIPGWQFLSLANCRWVTSSSLGQGSLAALSPAPPRPEGGTLRGCSPNGKSAIMGTSHPTLGG